MDEEQTRSSKIIACKISKSDLDQLDNPQTTQEHIIINDSNLKSENYFYNENKLLKSNLSFNENQINSLKEQLFILTEQNQKIKQESSLLSNTISSQTNLIDHLKEQNLELTNKLNTQNTTITQLNQKLNENLTIIQSHQSQINSLNMELLSLKQGLENKNTEIKIHLKNISDLNLLKSENEIKINQLNNELNQIKIRKAEMENNLNKKIIKLEENEKMYFLSTENLEKQNTNYLSQINSLQKSQIMNTNDYKEQISSLNEQQRKLYTKIQNKENELNQKDEMINILTIEKNNLISSINSLNNTLIQTKSENNCLKEIINDKENEIHNLNTIQNKMKTKTFFDINSNLIKAEKGDTSDMSLGDSQVLKNDLSTLKAKVKDLINEKELLNRSNIVLSTQANNYNQVKEQLTALKNENEKLIRISKEHDALKEKCDDLTYENTQYKKTLNFLSKQNQHLLFTKTKENNKDSFLQKKIARDEYDSYLYDSIEELEIKLREMLNKTIQQEKKEEKNNEIINSLRKENEDIKQVMIQMEEYTSKIEQTNKELLAENNSLKEGALQNKHKGGSNLNESLHIDELNKRNEKVNALKEQIKTLNIQLHKEKENFNTLNIENQALKNKNKTLELDIIEYRKKNVTTESENKQLQQELNKVTTETKIFLNQIQELKNTNATLINDKELLNKTINQVIKDNNNKFEQTKNFFEQSIKQLNNENVAMKQLLNNLDTNVNKSINELQSGTFSNMASQKIPQLPKEEENKEIADLKKQITQYKLTIENLETENSMLKYNLSLYSSSNQGYNINNTLNIIKHNQEESQSISKIEDKYIKSINKVKELEQENLSLKKQISFLQETNNGLLNKDMSSPYKYLIFQLEQLTKEKTQLDQEYNSLLASKSEITKLYTELNIQKEELTTKLSILEKAHLQSTQDVTTLTQQNESLLNEVKVLKENKEFTKERDTLLKQKNEELQTKVSKISELENSLNEKIKIEEELNAKVKSLNESLEENKKLRNISVGKHFLTVRKSASLLTNLQTIIVNLKEELNNFETKQSKYEEKISNLELEKTKLDKIIVDKNIKEKTLQEKIINLEKAIKAKAPIKEESKDNNNGLDNIGVILEKSQFVIKALKEENQLLLKQKGDLEKENECLKNNSKINVNEKGTIVQLKKDKIASQMKYDLIEKQAEHLKAFILSQSKTTNESESQDNNNNKLWGPEKSQNFKTLIIQMKKAIVILNYFMSLMKQNSI